MLMIKVAMEVLLENGSAFMIIRDKLHAIPALMKLETTLLKF